MGFLVTNGAQIMCTFGTAPSALTVLPQNKVLSGAPAANIMDMKPMVNILPFAMCTSMSNPTVAAATAAALGVLTPQPCIPSITGPWMPGSSKVLVAGSPALHNNCQAMCAYGGMIKFTAPSQTTTMVAE